MCDNICVVLDGSSSIIPSCKAFSSFNGRLTVSRSEESYFSVIASKGSQSG